VVTAVNGNVLTVLGINGDVTLATFEGAGPSTLTAFLAAITPGSTLVKLSGAFTAGSPSTMAVDEAELED
jgi:ABC-type cobalamin transport system ATPase subunit